MGGEGGEAIFYNWLCLLSFSALISGHLCLDSDKTQERRHIWTAGHVTAGSRCHNSHFNWNMWHCHVKCEPGSRATWHRDIRIIRMTDDRCHHGIRTHQTPGDQCRVLLRLKGISFLCHFIRRLCDSSFTVDCKMWMHCQIVTCYWPVLIQRRKNRHKLEL